MGNQVSETARRGRGIVFGLVLITALSGGVLAGAKVSDDPTPGENLHPRTCCQSDVTPQTQPAERKGCGVCAAEDKGAKFCPSCTSEGKADHAEASEPRGKEQGGPPVGMQDIHDTIHDLLGDHKKIKRTVKHIPGGVLTETTSKDVTVAATIRKHVRQVKFRVESGQPMRRWDPLFEELFKHHTKIKMHVELIEGGVRVKETSDDPQVVLLIRQHADRGVSEFVKYGVKRARQPSPLPEGYKTDR